ncbi:MAG: DUF2339 domain-containing protein [Rhodanobacteraceae bacterium]
MAFVYVVICCVVGLIVGGVVGNDSTAGFGFFAGIAFGLVFARLRTLSMRVAALEKQPAVAPAIVAGRPVAPAPVEAAAPPFAASEPATPPGLPPRAPAPVPASIIDSAARRAAMASAAPPATSAAQAAAPPRIPNPRTPPQPNAVDAAIAAIKRWFTEGNVPVKVGMLVLIAGVAALLKYASDQGWVHVPVELRLAGIAAAAIAALAFGWRVRERKRSFALSVQGGAIGVLLMTVFAAFRLYQLLPAGAAFALMLVLVAGTGLLAVLQDALALAVFGLVAGFAAPILISTGSGNHVVLFSYYALLNLAIFAIAWKKAWRSLNLLGFFFTYAIGTLWGVLRYEPALRDTTEPFLIIFFAIYLAIPILYAWRIGESKRDLVDGTLVFGNPLVAFALQAALLDGERMPLAYSALALAAVYAVLAFLLIRRDRLRVLGESFAVLAVGFATLALPLALSARSTACTFALEGAALVWLGMRQQRRLPLWTGVALQLIAAGAFAMSVTFGAGGADTTALANGGFISAMLIAGAALASAWLLSRDGAHVQAATLLYGWGLAWWIGAWLREVDRFVAPDHVPPALLGVLALTIALAGAAWHFVRRSAPAWTAAIGLAFGIALALLFLELGVRPYSGWGVAAFAAFAVAGFFALGALRNASDRVLGIAHSGWLWTWIVAIGLSLRMLAEQNALADGWRDALTVLPLLVAWMLVLRKPAAIAPPLGERIGAWRSSLLASQALAAIVAFALLLIHDGATTPLPYVPILNPIELAQLAILVCLARWLADPQTAPDLSQRRLTLLVALGFAFVTAATLRGVHHLANVPWDGEIGSSMVAQTSLTVVWSVLGVVGWVMGSRRGSRSLWLAGAVLMGIVLAKLLLIDRTHLGSGFGIASFIAYGLLCTVIGYFAPAPPRDAATSRAAAGDSA